MTVGACVYPIKLNFVISNFLPEHEHLFVHTPVAFLFFRDGRTVLILVPELDDVESAAVHIKVNVPLLEVRSNGFPDLDFWMQCFNGLPCCLANAFAMGLRQHKQ